VDDEVDIMRVGVRFKMSELGAIRCPKLADKIGTIVGKSGRNTAIAVLFDGNKTATYLHKDYISPSEKKPQA
jgi:hypothetical protein